MTCEQTLPLLDAFADGELGWGNAWRVRRHLAGCAACTAELAEIQHLGSRVQAWNDVSAPAGLEARLAATLPRVALPVIRRPFPMRRAAVGLAGLTIASAVFVWLIPGQPGRPTIALADVEKAMQGMQVVSYDTHSKTVIYDAHGRLIPSNLQTFRQIWIRRTPPAIYEYDPMLHIRHLEDTRGTLIYDEKLRKYSKAPFHDNRTYSLKYSSILNRYVKVPFHPTIQMRVDEDMAFVTETPANTDYSNWTQQKAELNGIACQKFTQTNPLTSAGTRLQSQTSIWIDVNTLRVIRLESEGKANLKEAAFINKSYRYRLVEDNIRYNQTPPQGVFDWSPPPGAKVEGYW